MPTMITDLLVIQKCGGIFITDVNTRAIKSASGVTSQYQLESPIYQREASLIPTTIVTLKKPQVYTEIYASQDGSSLGNVARLS